MDPIKIYNPRDVPFGELSNNSIHFIVLDNKRWATVTNYILSNMLTTPIYRLALQTSQIQGNTKKTNVEDKLRQMVSNIEARERRKITSKEMGDLTRIATDEIAFQRMNIYQLYNYYLGLEYTGTLRTAVENAYNSKVAENPHLADILLSTENRPILYVSDNFELGTGPDGNGYNIIGKTLEQLRYNLQIQHRIEQKVTHSKEQEDAIFEAYTAYIILQKEMKENNDLSEYIDLLPSDIIKIYTEKGENVSSLGIYPDLKETIVQMYNRDQLPLIRREINLPRSLASIMRKEGLGGIKDRLNRLRNKTIVQIYTQYVIAKKYPEMQKSQVKEASTQLEIASPDTEKLLELSSHIIELYNEQKLPDECINKIKKALSKLQNLPEEDESESKTDAESESPEEDDEQSSESSISEENPLKQLLAPDEKSRKIFLIKLIQSYTGKSDSKYKKWDIERLEKELSKYEDGTRVPENGVWEIKISHKNGRKEIIKEIKGEKPSQEKLDRIISKYNSSKNTNISRGQVAVIWTNNSDHKPSSVPEEPKERAEISEIDGYIKINGDPINIRQDPLQSDDDFQEFSPLFQGKFTVNNYVYPSVSIYITTMLLTKTGIKTDIKKKVLFSRGSSAMKARKLLTRDGDFVDPDEANQIYDEENVRTHRELLSTFARIAIKKKFTDESLKNLLLLSEGYLLLWDDPNDNFLGKGDNVVGNILMELRDEFYIESQPSPKIDSKHISRFVTKDPFMESWFKMRLSDMCGVVYKLKQYLSETGKQEEEIDARFVKSVLDVIYQPCSMIISMSDKVDSSASEYFIRLVESCQGLPKKLTKDYDTEIKALMREREGETTTLSSDRQSSADFNLVKFTEKQSEDYTRFLKSNPTEEEIQTFKEERENERNLALEYNSSPARFELSQRQEYEKFLEEINRPKLSEEQIKKKMRKLENNQKGVSKPTVEVLEEQKKEREQLWKKLHNPEMSPEDREDRLNNFFTLQERRRIEHYGIREGKIGEEEFVRREEIYKDLGQKIAELSKQKKDEIDHYHFLMRDISQVYWDRLIVMVNFLVQHLQDSNEQDIRKAIVSIEMLNSEKTECNNTTNLDNEEDNCIASAIANLLIGIQKFKHQYGEHIPFGKADIDLAGNIILNRDVSEQEIPEEETPEVILPLEELEQDEFEDDMLNDVLDEEITGEESISFGMGKAKIEPNPQIEPLKIIIREITKQDLPDLDKLANNFAGTIASIKTAKIPKRVKQNRINFFATLR